MSIMQRRILRHLTDDDIVGFQDRLGFEIPYRVRVWQGEGESSLVLVSHIDDPGCMWPGPSLLTVKIANFVNQAYLAMPDRGFLYLEDEVNRKTGRRELSRVSFEFYGYHDRVRLHKPIRQLDDWSLVEHLACGPVER